jgi:hypothetical protein
MINALNAVVEFVPDCNPFVTPAILENVRIIPPLSPMRNDYDSDFFAEQIINSTLMNSLK